MIQKLLEPIKMLSDFLTRLQQKYIVHTILGKGIDERFDTPLGKYGYHIIIENDNEQTLVDITTRILEYQLEDELYDLASLCHLPDAIIYLTPVHRS